MTIDDLNAKTEAGFKEVRAEMHDGFKNVRAEMHNGFRDVRAEMHAGFQEASAHVQASLQDVRSEIKREAEITRRHFDIVAEQFKEQRSSSVTAPRAIPSVWTITTNALRRSRADGRSDCSSQLPAADLDEESCEVHAESQPIAAGGQRGRSTGSVAGSRGAAEQSPRASDFITGRTAPSVFRQSPASAPLRLHQR